MVLTGSHGARSGRRYLRARSVGRVGGGGGGVEEGVAGNFKVLPGTDDGEVAEVGEGHFGLEIDGVEGVRDFAGQ